MSCRLFVGFRKGGGQWHMGVPCTFVRPCMTVHHKKLHIGILSHLSNKSVCIDEVPLGLLTTFVGSIDICCRVSIVRTAVHGGSMHRCLAKHGFCPTFESVCIDGVPLGFSTISFASVDICLLGFNSADSRTRGLHAQVSGHAWMSPMRNHTVEVYPAFQMHLGR